MESVLDTINISNPNVKLTCCLEYSIATNDVAYCVLNSLLSNISEVTQKNTVIASTCYDKSKSLLRTIFQPNEVFFFPIESTVDEIQSWNSTKTNDYSILYIDSITPLFNSINIRKQILQLKQLLTHSLFNAVIVGCPLELTSTSTRLLLEKTCNLVMNINQNALIITSTKPSGKVIRNKFIVNIKENKCILSNMAADVEEEGEAITEAKTYAASITILNSTENKAPELVYEEDEMDEDGDEDDDIDDDLNI